MSEERLMTRSKIAIVGAGPVGLDAAAAAIERGYDAEIFERGEIADAVRQWGHVRMFSLFSMNSTTRGLTRARRAQADLPAPDDLLTGAEFRNRYLLPLARSFGLDILHERTPVLAISRARTVKSDHVGAPARGDRPFRLLVAHEGEERIASADFVLDCSGTYGQPSHLGDGGIPAPGERHCAEWIHYRIPDLASSARTRFVGRRVLVVGAGHSAATVIRDLAETDPATEIHWLLRRDRGAAAEEVPDDPLPERARLAASANRFVRERRVALHRGASVDAIVRLNGALQVALADESDAATLTVDEIVVATGFRPDMNLARELQVQTCWATEGTYPLAASLLGETGADCLATPAFGADMLTHPEPGYFTLGMKSYGRSPNFLLRTGYEQVETVLDWIDMRRLESANAV